MAYTALRLPCVPRVQADVGCAVAPLSHPVVKPRVCQGGESVTLGEAATQMWLCSLSNTSKASLLLEAEVWSAHPCAAMSSRVGLRG